MNYSEHNGVVVLSFNLGKMKKENMKFTEEVTSVLSP